MTTRAVKFAAVLAGLLIAASAVRAEDADPSAPKLQRPNFPYKTVQTKEGLVFYVPADMPIEMRDGIQAPIPFDEYVYGKFGRVESKISQMNDRLNRIEEKLDRLAVPGSPIMQSAPADAPVAPETESTGILKAGIE